MSLNRIFQYNTRLLFISCLHFSLASLLVSLMPDLPTKRECVPLQINDIVVVDEGVLVSEKGTSRVSLYSSDLRRVICEWTFDETPTGIAVSKDHFWITTFSSEGKLHRVDRKSRVISGCVAVQSGAISPIYNGVTEQDIYVLNQFSGTVSAIDISDMVVRRSVNVLREPRVATLDVSGRYLYVANFLPAQRADVDSVAACVSVIDTKNFRKVKDIRLCNGSNALRGIATSTDGKYIFVTHNLGRFQVPTNQLQQGWMNTSAMSVIDVSTRSYVGAVLLDEPERGAAGIWSIRCTPEHLYISHSGTHDLSILDYPAFVSKFEAYPDKAALAYDLRFMNGIRRRVPLKGNAPRTMALSGNRLFVPTYFSDTLNVISTDGKLLNIIALVENRKESVEQRGEKYFNDATYCFQNWQSCNGCHPGDARTDAMNWDLMNDGIGNSKNCKSMLYSHLTAPSMISGIRESAELAVRKGYNLIQFAEIPEEYAECVDAYLKSLRHVPSPYLINGELSAQAKRGEKVFDRFKCSECHSGPHFTDRKMYRIGKDVEFEKGWDTPTLIETWRTAPYLFDGRAATMRDVFETHKHGIDRKISKREIDELVEYVNSL